MNQLLNPYPSAPAADLRRPMTHPTVQAVTADLAARSGLLREHYLPGVRSRAGGPGPGPGPASVALIDVHGDPTATQLARDRIRLGGAIARSFGGGPVPCSLTERDRDPAIVVESGPATAASTATT